MPFDYYYRLSRKRRFIYDRSDGIQSVPLTGLADCADLLAELEASLAAGDQKRTAASSNALVELLCRHLGAPAVKVKVLSRRPSANWGELHGLYEPVEARRRATITVWMRTAARKQVVAFRTYVRTVLHELCHHLDYELYGLEESLHTEGFFKRESSLFKQLVSEATTSRA